MKVLIIAYCNGNLGDDLFVYELCNRYPQHEFYLVGDSKYENLFFDCKNLKYIYLNDKKWIRYANVRNKFRKVLNKEKDSIITSIRLKLKKKCDLTVLIGGSVFIQQDNWRRELDSRKRLLPGKTVLLGCNYRLANSKEYHNEYLDLLSKTEDVCFRDKSSYEQFASLPNTRVASDILFGVNNEDCETKDYYVISVIDASKKVSKQEHADMYYKRMAECADLLQNKGHKVILFSFCEAECDLEAINKVKSYINNKDNLEVFEHSNIEKSLYCLKNCKGIITARFHGMVLGIRFGKEVFPIIYSDKTTQVLKDIEFTGMYSSIGGLAEISSEDIYKQLQKGYDVNKNLNPEEQFKILDRILLKK